MALGKTAGSRAVEQIQCQLWEVIVEPVEDERIIVVELEHGAIMPRSSASGVEAAVVWWRHALSRHRGPRIGFPAR